MNLKKRITLLISGAFFICSLSFSLLAYINSSGMLTQQITESQIDIAEKTAEAISEWFNVRKNVIATAAAAASSFSSDSPQVTINQFELLSESAGFTSVYVGFSDKTFYDSSGWDRALSWFCR